MAKELNPSIEIIQEEDNLPWLTPRSRPVQYQTLNERKVDIFFERLAETGDILMAQLYSGIDYETILALKLYDYTIQDKWQQAMDSMADLVELALYRQALEGNTKAAMFILRGRKSSIYGNQQSKPLFIEHQEQSKDWTKALPASLERIEEITNAGGKKDD